MMKTLKISSLFIAAMAVCISTLPVGGYAADTVAKVNGKEIPQSRADFIVKANAGQGQADTPELRGRVREVLIRNEILSQEAVKKGLDKSPEFMTQIELNRQDALVNAYIQDYVKNNPISD